MQLILFYIFAILCGYSLVNSAPVNSITPDSQETKQQKATAIAGRLLKELAGENHVDINQAQPNHEKAEVVVPVNHPAPHTVESADDQQSPKTNDDNNDDVEIDFPTIEELYRFYNDLNGQRSDIDSSSENNDDDYILPINQEELIRYLAEQDNTDDEHLPSLPVMDDSVMRAENHRRRRRSLV
jgi:hypothetical protein